MTDRPARTASILLGALAGVMLAPRARADGGVAAAQPDARWTSREPCAPLPPQARPAAGSWYRLGIEVMRFHASDSTGTSTGVAAGLDADSFLDRPLLSAVWGVAFRLGGGSGGFVGDGRVDLAVGLHADLGPNHGPFARIGGRTRGFGNDNLLWSTLSLPSGEVGYELRDDGVAFDVGARSALVVSGRWGTEEGIRRDFAPAPDFGAFGWLLANPLALRAEWQHIVPADANGALPLDVVEASACTTLPPGLRDAQGSFGFTLCVDGASFGGGVFSPGASAPHSAQVTYGGVSIGLGGAGSERARPPGATGTSP